EEELLTALRRGEITSTAALGERWLSSLDTSKFKVTSEPLPRVFSIFMNQNRTPVLRDASVRRALNAAIDRDELISRSVNGFGRGAYSPIPADWIDGVAEAPAMSREERLAAATAILVEGGWTQNQNG